MSAFGRIFRVTTFGESHCKGVGAIVEGVPASLELSEKDIQPQLTRRRPGQSTLTTPRDEKDLVSILSGVENGKTLGTPIGLFVPNENVRPQDYKEMSSVPRPGHADYTYQLKYGTRASSGGGRASARETIGRVAAGAIAEKWLYKTFGTTIVSWVSSIGDISIPDEFRTRSDGTPWTRHDVDTLGELIILKDPTLWQKITEKEVPDPSQREAAQKSMDWEYEQYFIDHLDDFNSPIYQDHQGNMYYNNGLIVPNPKLYVSWITDDVISVRCPHTPTAMKMATLVRRVKHEQDSIGGVVSCVCNNVPVGLGEPCFDKLEALLAHAMLSLPATKGFEIGSGFSGTKLRGSTHNDVFLPHEKGSPYLKTAKNMAGGTLGGISSGSELYFRVAVKPVSTIGIPQQTADFQGSMTLLEAKGRHDPCVLPRTPPLLESMAALVLADAALIQKTRCGNDKSLIVTSLSSSSHASTLQ